MAGNHLKQWATGKPIGVALFGREVAAAAGNFFWYLRALHTGQGLQRLGPPPPLRLWLSFYRDPNRLQDAILDGWEPVKPGECRASEVARALQRMLRAFSRMTPEQIKAELATIEPGEWSKGFRVGQRIGRQLVADQDKEIDDAIAGRMSEKDSAAAERMMPSAEMQFFLRVWLPCMLLYKQYPTRLFHAARVAKDTRALEKLLKLDKSVLADPVIAERVHRLGAGFKRVDLGRIARAFGAGPNKLNRKEFKDSLAGLISWALGGVDKKLTAPEIGRLFDAFSRDSGQELDSRPPESESMQKAVQRRREDWKNIIPRVDIKTS